MGIGFLMGQTGGGGTVPHGSQTYNTPGTYTFTVPNGVTGVFFMATGGGGGGGAGNVTAGGGGGGAGGTYSDFLDVTPGQTIPVVVGTGGAKCASSYSNGSPGGYSTFYSATYKGFGGGAGLEEDVGSDGGAGGAGGGYTPTGGGNGGNGTSSTGGAGGKSIRALGGASTTTATPNPGAAGGGGGAGAYSPGSGSSSAAGAGGGGEVVVIW